MMVEFPSGVSIVLAGSTVNERGLEDVIRGTKANLTMGGNRLQVVPERPFVDEDRRARRDAARRGRDTREAHAELPPEPARTTSRRTAARISAIRVQTVVSMAELAFRKQRQVRFDERKREIVV